MTFVTHVRSIVQTKRWSVEIDKINKSKREPTAGVCVRKECYGSVYHGCRTTIVTITQSVNNCVFNPSEKPVPTMKNGEK